MLSRSSKIASSVERLGRYVNWYSSLIDDKNVLVNRHFKHLDRTGCTATGGRKPFMTLACLCLGIGVVLAYFQMVGNTPVRIKVLNNWLSLGLQDCQHKV